MPFKEAPKFNPRRRTSGITTFSSPRNTVGGPGMMPQNLRPDPRDSPRAAAGAPSSPSPSDRSIPPFSSGSSISETTSTGSGSSSMVSGMPGTNKIINNNKTREITQQNHHQQQQPISLLQQSLQNSLVIHEDEQLDSASILAVSLGNGEFVFKNTFTLV